VTIQSVSRNLLKTLQPNYFI